MFKYFFRKIDESLRKKAPEVKISEAFYSSWRERPIILI